MKTNCAGYERMAKFYVSLSVLLSICSGLLSIVFAYTVKIVVDYATNDLGYSLIRTVVRIVVLLLLVVVINLSRNLAIAKAVFNVNRSTKSKLFRSFFDDHKHNNDTDFVSVLSNDISVIESDFFRAMFDFVELATTFLISSIVLFTYSFVHGIVILLISVFLVAGSHFLKDKVGSKRLAVSNCNEHYISKVKDMFYGVVVVRQFLAISKISNEHDIVDEQLEKSKMNFSIFVSTVSTFATLMTMGMFVISYLLGGYLVLSGVYSISMMMSAIQLVNNIAGPLEGVTEAINKINGATAIVRKVRALCADNECESDANLGKIDKIVVKNLNFSFNDAFAFDDVSISFSQGKKYALVGESGSGKTTLLNLLVKEQSAERGQIFVNGKDLADIPYADVGTHISYMNQNVYLFNDTVKNNITLYGEFDENEYAMALKSSGVYRIINELTNGDQYMIRDNGGNISGGQKQRIALARVMLKKSDVIILDEAFSALDPITAEQLLSDIMKLDCMIIVVFHKYNKTLLSQFDEIFAMKRGKIIERGDFQTLMQKEGYFYSLYNIDNIEENE